MKKVIYIFLRTKEQQKSNIKTFQNDRFIIIIVILNPKTDIYNIICGQRAHVAYCDASFTADRAGKDYINEIIKPLVNLGNKQFYLI